jgi:hypothetical protein
LFSGVLVMPTAASLAKATPVESYDVLEYQFQREQDILADHVKGSYSPQNPYIIQDPYQANPLSALVLFETAEPAQVSVTVGGKNQVDLAIACLDTNYSYLLGKVLFMLKNREHQYIFASNAGVNENFSARFDLSQVAPGEYAIHAAGGVVKGMNALGKVKPGYNPTSYKIQVP